MTLSRNEPIFGPREWAAIDRDRLRHHPSTTSAPSTKTTPLTPDGSQPRHGPLTTARNGVSGVGSFSHRKPVLLDLFCKAGGCSVGYAQAGFEVCGVDIEPQPNYPTDFYFTQADALDVLREPGRYGIYRIDAIHASPPCQFATDYIRTGNVKESPNLIPQTRERLRATGLPYVIENVQGARAELEAPILICGSMFDPPMDIRRHRLFEANWLLEAPAWPCRHKLQGPNRFPGGRSKERTGASTGNVRNTIEIGSWDVPYDRQAEAMGVDWKMTLPELSNAIPPTYTEFIGQQLMAHVRREAIAA